MGIDVTFGKAYAKAAIAAGQRLPQSGNVFITMMDKYKEAAVPIAKDLQALGFGIMATYNTAAHLRAAGLKDVQSVLKVQEGRPNAGKQQRPERVASGWAGGWEGQKPSYRPALVDRKYTHFLMLRRYMYACFFLSSNFLSSCLLPAPLPWPGLQRT
jgi:hypothetical protein